MVEWFDGGGVAGHTIRSAYWIDDALNEFLTAAEFDAVEQVDEGRNRPIPKHFSDRLLELGYIQKIVDDLAITSAGQMRLALGL